MKSLGLNHCYVMQMVSHLGTTSKCGVDEATSAVLQTVFFLQDVEKFRGDLVAEGG